MKHCDNFKAKMEDIQNLSQSLDSFFGDTLLAEKEDKSFREKKKREYNESLMKIDAEFKSMLESCEEKSKNRAAYIDEVYEYMKKLFDRIEDPHWHRTKEYYSGIAYEKSADKYKNKTAKQLYGIIGKKLDYLKKEIIDLQHAFIPPELSGIIGLGVPSYREGIYTNIAEAREDVLSCLDALGELDDIDLKAQNEEYSRNIDRQNLKTNYEDELSPLPGRLYEKKEQLKQKLFNELEEHYNAGVFDGMAGIQIGAYISGCPEIPEHLQKYTDKDTEYMNFCVTVSDIGENVLFLTDDKARLSHVFSSYAADILKNSPDADIYIADAEGFGSNYSKLSKLENLRKVHIWKNDDEIAAGLASVGKWIAEASAKGTSIPKKYIFAENIEKNICTKDLGTLCRILQSGKAAGVHAVMSMRKSFVPERHCAEIYDTVKKSSCIYEVERYKISIGNSGIFVVCGRNVEQNAAEAYEICINNVKQKSVIPLDAQLPKHGLLNKKSSACGIEIPVGVDSNGTEVKLHLYEEKPYAIIVGDMDVGKSSLLHTIVIQTLTNYDSSQVKLAIGDFKTGAEFNIYASSNLKSVDTVVYDEDPDVMASFLRYYVSEMVRRQQVFSLLSEHSGKLIRKYETYREVYDETGYGELLPRIIIIVDEFQSLFEKTAETAFLMSHLVRKARTYGMHIVMASQRAVSEDPKNTFTGDLKDFFTSRFVLRCPQTAARSVLSERCADTGKENSGIPAASLLKKGHAIYNSYIGQTEKDNCTVQCYYASDDTVEAVCEMLKQSEEPGNSILLKKDAVSIKPTDAYNGDIVLGMSPCLHNDFFNSSNDIIRDDTTVVLRTDVPPENIIISGSDIRVAQSFAESVERYITSNRIKGKIHIHGTPDSLLIKKLIQHKKEAYEFHTTREEQINELTAQLNGEREYFVNIFCQPENMPYFVQGFSSIRTSAESELYKNILSLAERGKGFSVTVSKYFKSIKNDLCYVVSDSAVRLTGVGDAENLRNTMPDCYGQNTSEFDIPSKKAVKAYYFNKNTEKSGKVIMFEVDGAGD